jgi:co-chaperonin GroES (HSP10)
MEIVQLRGEWIRVELEPARERSRGGIIMPGAQPIRLAKVLQTGPGRRGRKGQLIPMSLKVGDRFPFFKAAADTQQGRQLGELLPEGQELIKESDVLFVIEEGDIEVSL